MYKAPQCSSSKVEIPPLGLLQRASYLFHFNWRSLEFFRDNSIELVGDLVAMDREGILRCRGLGNGYVDDIEAFVGELGFRLGMRIPGWRPAVASLLAEVRAEGLRLGRLKIARRKGWIEPDAADSVETEIKMIAAWVLSPRNAAIVRSWVGLESSRTSTKAEVGRWFDLSGERVRQIVNHSRIRCRWAGLPALRLFKAMRYVESRAPASEEEILKGLRVEGLCESGCRLSILERASAFMEM